MKTPEIVKSLPAKSFDTPSMRVQRYWFRRPFEAWLLMHKMMSEQSEPPKFEWPRMKGVGRFHTINGRWTQTKFKPMFREPPKSPYSHLGCPMCGGVRYNLGWHEDWDGKGKSARGYWHVPCNIGLTLMQNPHDFWKNFFEKQNGICALSGEPLGEHTNFDIDHIIPLYQVYRDFNHLPLIEFIKFWGPDNLRAITKAAHKEKNSQEAAERAGR